MSSVISLRLRRNMFSSSCGGSKWCGATGGTAVKGFGDGSGAFSAASLFEFGNFDDESSAANVVIFVVDSNDSQLNALYPLITINLHTLKSKNYKKLCIKIKNA